MSSGPVGGGIARTRSIWRFLSVDPEIYPLIGVLAGTFGVAGYMMGRKGSVPNSENNIKLSKNETFPWHSSNSEGQGVDYKYKFHDLSKPDEVLKAPSAVATHTVQVDVPKDVAQQIDEKFGGEKS
jgi:hypothetical protein